jgi:hypothetical protein
MAITNENHVDTVFAKVPIGDEFRDKTPDGQPNERWRRISKTYARGFDGKVAEYERGRPVFHIQPVNSRSVSHSR